MLESSPFNQLLAGLAGLGWLSGGLTMSQRNSQLADLQRAAQESIGNPLGGLGQGQAMPPPSIHPCNIEQACQRVSELICHHVDIISLIGVTTDRVNGGGSPDKVPPDPEECPADGQLNELHRLLGVLENQTEEAHRRLALLSDTI